MKNSTIKKDTHKTKVQFFIEKSDPDTTDNPSQVFAFFPEIYWNKELYKTTFTGYSHIGQHSAVHIDYIKECKPATPDEYNELKTELESLGYNLEVAHDLFETPELIPEEVKRVLGEFTEFENTYEGCRRLKAELNKIGYTIDYYLDAQPYNLRKIDVAQD